MTDRELLEQAAKAAGEKGRVKEYLIRPFVFGLAFFRDNDLKPWNPLTDDGDALRLAVKLEFLINHTELINVYDGGEVDVFEEIGSDPYAATRRAIVRAAAEIGKSL